MGDRLYDVNGQTFGGKTREEAVEMLLNLGDNITINFEHSIEEFQMINAHQLGDSFYIRYVENLYY